MRDFGKSSGTEKPRTVEGTIRGCTTQPGRGVEEDGLWSNVTRCALPVPHA